HLETTLYNKIALFKYFYTNKDKEAWQSWHTPLMPVEGRDRWVSVSLGTALEGDLVSEEV
ncbi:hypothetical protein ACQP3J_33170, partial [Escherichia coli]